MLACLAEEYNDEAGLVLPLPVAPYQVHLVSLVKDSDIGDQLYQELCQAGIEVLYDDRKESAGVKFADADLLGVPIRLTLGNRSMKEGKIEVKLRKNLQQTLSNDLNDPVGQTKAIIDSLQKEVDDEVVEKTLS